MFLFDINSLVDEYLDEDFLEVNVTEMLIKVMSRNASRNKNDKSWKKVAMERLERYIIIVEA